MSLEDEDKLLPELVQRVQASCPHSEWEFLDSRTTDSDSEIEMYICTKCNTIRKEEILGSTIRSESHDTL